MGMFIVCPPDILFALDVRTGKGRELCGVSVPLSLSVEDVRAGPSDEVGVRSTADAGDDELSLRKALLEGDSCGAR